MVQEGVRKWLVIYRHGQHLRDVEYRICKHFFSKSCGVGNFIQSHHADLVRLQFIRSLFNDASLWDSQVAGATVLVILGSRVPARSHVGSRSAEGEVDGKIRQLGWVPARSHVGSRSAEGEVDGKIRQLGACPLTRWIRECRIEGESQIPPLSLCADCPLCADYRVIMKKRSAGRAQPQHDGHLETSTHRCIMRVHPTVHCETARLPYRP